MLRSDPSRRAKARRRYAAITAGTWNYNQPAELVADHIKKLTDAGMTLTAIAATAGVSVGTVSYIRRGGFTSMVLGDVAQALLSVPVPAYKPPIGKNLPARGTQRRIQALLAIGYPMTRQAALCGIDDTVLHYIAYAGVKAPTGQRIKHPTVRGVTRVTAAAVDAMYQAYSHRPLPRDRFTQRARNLAAAHGWLPPDAWTDESIDDPDATPYSAADLPVDDQPDDVAVAMVLAGERRWVALTREADRREVARQLAARGLAAGGIASRVSTSTSVIRRLLAADAEVAA
jgi:hypothetical protein